MYFGLCQIHSACIQIYSACILDFDQFTIAHMQLVNLDVILWYTVYRMIISYFITISFGRNEEFDYFSFPDELLTS